MAKCHDGVALDRRRYDGGSQRLPSIESLQAPARPQNCACSSSIQVRHGASAEISPQHLFAWRKAARHGQLALPADEAAMFVPGIVGDRRAGATTASIMI